MFSVIVGIVLGGSVLWVSRPSSRTCYYYYCHWRMVGISQGSIRRLVPVPVAQFNDPVVDVLRQNPIWSPWAGNGAPLHMREEKGKDSKNGENEGVMGQMECCCKCWQNGRTRRAASLLAFLLLYGYTNKLCKTKHGLEGRSSSRICESASNDVSDLFDSRSRHNSPNCLQRITKSLRTNLVCTFSERSSDSF